MSAPRSPGFASCFLLLVVVDAATHVLGLRRVLAWSRRLSRADTTVRSAATTSFIERTAHSVALAAAFYPRRARCLEQSLTLYVLLRRGGVSAQLRLGVQPRPFYAHAWVEVDGMPVNESGDLPLQLSAFPLLGG